MTVSLVLRGDPSGSRISAETRQRVLEAAREFNYLPNARARALRTGYTNIVGLYTGYGPVKMRLPFYVEVVSGLQEGCEQFQKDLLFFGLFHGQNTEAIFTGLVDGRVDGLVANMPPDDPLAARFVESRFPVVAIANPIPGLPSVTVDDDQGSRMLAEYLYGQGYRRFFYLESEVPYISTIRRRESFEQSIRAYGLEVENWDWQSGRWDTFLAMLRASRQEGRPVAVACWNDVGAYDLLTRLRHHAIRVPEEVAIVGFDGCDADVERAWELTTIRAPWAEVARTALQTLNALLEGRPVPDETMLPVTLSPGKTT